MAAVRFMFLWTHREKENLKQCKQRASYLFVLDTGSTMAETVSLPNGRSVTKMHRGLEYIQAKMAFYVGFYDWYRCFALKDIYWTDSTGFDFQLNRSNAVWAKE